MITKVCPAGGEFAITTNDGEQLARTGNRALAERVALLLSMVPQSAIDAGLDPAEFAQQVLTTCLTLDTLHRFGYAAVIVETADLDALQSAVDHDLDLRQAGNTRVSAAVTRAIHHGEIVGVAGMDLR